MEEFYFEDEDKESEGSIDIKRFWRAILKKWWLWSAFTIVVSIPWVLFVKSEKPIYQATAIIQYQNTDGSLNQQVLEYRVQKFTSRSFAEKIVEELGLVLDVKPYFDNKPAIRTEIFSEFSTSRHPDVGDYIMRFPGDGTFIISKLPEDEELGEVELIYTGFIDEAQRKSITCKNFEFKLADKLDTFPDDVNFSIQGFRGTVDAFRERVNVNFGRTGSMEVTMQDNDPYLVAKMTNRLAEIYIRESVEVEGDFESDYGRALTNRLNTAEQKYKDAQDALSQFQQLHGINLEQERQALDRGMTRSENRYQVIRDNNRALEDLIDRAKRTKQSIQGNEPGEISSELREIYHSMLDLPIFDGDIPASLAKNRLERNENKYDESVRRTSVANDESVSLAQIIRSIFEEIDTLVTNKVKENKRLITNLNQEIATLRRQLDQHPELMSEYNRLSQEYENAKEFWQTQQKSQLDFALTTTSKGSNISIMDEAIPPEYPINRDKKTKAATGTIVIFAFSIFIVLGIEFLDKSLKSVDDVKRTLKINVLGTIPEIDFEDLDEFQDSEKAKMIDNQLVTHNYSPTPIGEAYRSLRTSIMFSKSAGRIQTLVITSMSPGDGKSFTAANLAITMAQHKSNTLLVDTDLRRGVLHNTFGLSKEPGFSTYLTSNVPVPEIIQETHIPNLSVVSCGQLIPNPSELLGSHQMKRFLDDVRRRFDLIIFDTPPLNAATDAVVVGTQVDASVLVVRAGKTHKDVAKQKMELYQHVPAKVIGAILNGAGEEFAHEGYSYYQY